MIGSQINYMGRSMRVAMIGWLGERYYWLIDSTGAITMVPASVIEPSRP